MKVDDDYIEEFNKQRRYYRPCNIKSKRDYDPDKYQIAGFPDFTEYHGIRKSKAVYLLYAHLSEVFMSDSQEIKESDMNKPLGKTGTTGWAEGTLAPHLHFEISSVQRGKGFTNRYNPGYYIDYKNEEQLNEAERKIQDEAAGK